MKAKRAFLLIAFFLLFLAVLSAFLALIQREIPLKDKLALVRVEGPILQSKSVVEEIKGYVKDKGIKAIVLRVDSPGGGVVASQEIYEEVKKASAVKNVVVSMGAVAASGGYYISAAANRIVANPGTITGSIGVIMEVPNIKGLLEKLGVKTEVVKSGKHKDLASVFRGIGPEERAILQGVMDDVHEQFIQAVAEGRKMEIDEVKKISDGRIFSGRQAQEIGLVDEIGDLDHAVKTAAKLAGIAEEPEIVTKKERSLIFDLLSGGTHGQGLGFLPQVELKYQYMP